MTSHASYGGAPDLFGVQRAAEWRTAHISECGRYRYRLERGWGDSDSWVTWVMLNPSTADAAADDPTIRRVVAFSKEAGASGCRVVNLYAMRATDPRALAREAANGGDPGGPENPRELYLALHEAAGAIVVAWGARPEAEWPGTRFAFMAARQRRTLLCLGKTSSGAPRHPLYVPSATTFEVWQPGKPHQSPQTP